MGNQYTHAPWPERFWMRSTPEPNTGCWLWFASDKGNGYGMARFNGAATGAHRVAWMLANGPIPDSLFVLHKCDNGNIGCINPEHLWLGTAADNIRDALRKGRLAQQTRPWLYDGNPGPRPHTRKPQGVCVTCGGPTVPGRRGLGRCEKCYRKLTYLAKCKPARAAVRARRDAERRLVG